MKIGRNAPCPCGSEKKYKHCCLGSDEIAIRNVNADIVEENWIDYEPTDDSFEDITKVAILDDLRTEITDASYELEKHQKKFSRLLRKPAKFLKYAGKLFSEEPFENMCFTVNDMQMAFEKVGYPSDSDLFFNNTRKYIDCLVSEELQRNYAINLMILLPHYVAEKRYIDASIIQHSVMLMDESPEDVVPPFLMCLFMQGVNDWDIKRDDEQLEIFGKLGLDSDEIHRRGIEGLDSLIQEVMAKNENTDLNGLLNAHPKLKAFAEAQCYESEKIACSLMHHEDASRFFLSFDEVEPWLATFAQ